MKLATQNEIKQSHKIFGFFFVLFFWFCFVLIWWEKNARFKMLNSKTKLILEIWILILLQLSWNNWFEIAASFIIFWINFFWLFNLVFFFFFFNFLIFDFVWSWFFALFVCFFWRLCKNTQFYCIFSQHCYLPLFCCCFDWFSKMWFVVVVWYVWRVFLCKDIEVDGGNRVWQGLKYYPGNF